MKKALLFTGAVVILSGCGPSQKDLRTVNDLLLKAQDADCDTIKGYLAVAQKEVQKQIK